MKKPKNFTDALWDLCEPDLFGVILSDWEIDEIWNELVRQTKKTGFPESYLDWRDAAYDAMIELGYELTPED